jgi:hypothetical protein
MIFHAASLAALFFQQAQQAPVVAQCVLPLNTAPGLNQWIQPVLNLASILAVAGIAIWFFGATGRKEHRQWILDRKKAEWKDLLTRIAEIEHEIPVVRKDMPESLNFEAAVMGVLPRLRGMLFVYQSLKSSGFIGKWHSFAVHVSEKFMPEIDQLRMEYAAPYRGQESMENLKQQQEQCRKEESKVRRELYGLIEELRSLANKSLDIEERDPSGQK